MAHQAGIDAIQTGHFFVKGIVKNSSTAGKPFFNHIIFLTEGFLQQAGPAFVFGKTVRMGF